ISRSNVLCGMVDGIRYTTVGNTSLTVFRIGCHVGLRRRNREHIPGVYVNRLRSHESFVGKGDLLHGCRISRCSSERKRTYRTIAVVSEIQGSCPPCLSRCRVHPRRDAKSVYLADLEFWISQRIYIAVGANNLFEKRWYVRSLNGLIGIRILRIDFDNLQDVFHQVGSCSRRNAPGKQQILWLRGVDRSITYGLNDNGRLILSQIENGTAHRTSRRPRLTASEIQRL